MYKRWIHVTFIVVFLIAVCVWEELSVNAYLKEIDQRVSEIQTKFFADKNMQDPEMVFLVENLEEHWKRKETFLSIVLNHEEVYEIGEEIARLKGCIAVNQVEEFGVSLSVIRFHVDTFNKVMGLSLQNLF